MRISYFERLASNIHKNDLYHSALPVDKVIASGTLSAVRSSKFVSSEPSYTPFYALSSSEMDRIESQF